MKRKKEKIRKTRKTVLKYFLIIVLTAIIYLFLYYFYFQYSTYIAPEKTLQEMRDIEIKTEEFVKSKDVFNISKTNETPIVLIDKSHYNNFDIDDVSLLIEKLIKRGAKIDFLEKTNKTSALENKLEKSNAFIIISPKLSFKEEEIKEIKEFLKQGKKLLLVKDPEHSSNFDLLSTRFDIIFEGNYLYNLEENDGNFKFVFFKHFADNRIVDNLNKITLYITCAIRPNKFGIVFGDKNTFSSSSEIAEYFSPMVFHNNILAICDQTFMQQPYNAVTDNDKLISNIADWLVC